MDYEKKYKEALERAKKLKETCDSEAVVGWCEYIIPELKENGDERIRKEIISYIKNSTVCIDTNTFKKWIDWLEKQGKNNMGISEATKRKLEDNLNKALEKETPESWNKFLDEQGEQKPYGQREECLDCQFNYAGECKGFCAMKRGEQKPQGKTALEAAKEEKVDNQNCVKSADKVEPKFKVGDFIANDYCFGKVVALTNDAYLLDTEQGIPFSCEHNAHLWTIQDAKDGDVLVASDKSLFIYDGSINENGSVGFHIAFTENMDIILNSDDGCGWEEKDSCHPATKEQRELLFLKMKEAGYEWNDDKKELKKIEQKHTPKHKIGDTVYYDSFGRLISFVIANIVEDGTDNPMYEDKDGNSVFQNDIVEQKPTWSEKDEKILNYLLWFYDTRFRWNDTCCDDIKFGDIVNFLKSLKERYSWKPSDEQMHSLKQAINAFPYETDYLELLYEQLKKLTEE